MSYQELLTNWSVLYWFAIQPEQTDQDITEVTYEMNELFTVIVCCPEETFA
tara:strand:+ start:1979 stop:2131 length:153 start_codon:yes stop_codon:yes gene_type:complete